LSFSDFLLIVGVISSLDSEISYSVDDIYSTAAACSYEHCEMTCDE
jgi:hypothetical protein